MGRRKSKHRKPKIINKIPAAAAASSSTVPNKNQAAASSFSVPPPPWIELPGDVTANILRRLGAEEILESVQKVCTTWRKVCQDPSMWRVIDLPKRGICPDEVSEYATMCRRAVDLSQGQLVDLTIDFFADDELMNYIADRSSLLKRITLISVYDVSGEGLAEAVKKLPELEELHLMVAKNVLAEDVEEIGKSCPKLKSFSYYEREYLDLSQVSDFVDGRFFGNDYALAVGKSMPNLHHLGLFADMMRNEALEIILDGCPNLESLDIRQCFALDLEGDLGKRCCKQIKNLRLPSDSTSDIPWIVGGIIDPEFYFRSPFDTLSECDYDDYYEEYDGYDGYDGYGSHEDYFPPLGYGFFGGDGPDLFDHDYF